MCMFEIFYEINFFSMKFFIMILYCVVHIFMVNAVLLVSNVKLLLKIPFLLNDLKENGFLIVMQLDTDFTFYS